MKYTAAEYEQLATDRLGEFRDDTTEHFQDYNALQEAHVFSHLAVAQAVEKVWDELHELHARLDLAIPHPDD